MLMEPGELSGAVSDWKKRIAPFIHQHQSEFWVVEAETQLVGFLRIKGGSASRLSHSALVVVGIRQPYWNQGLGTQLFQKMEEWALQHEIIRLELTVMVGNRRAVGLYHKMGFVVEGLRRKSIRYSGGGFADEADGENPREAGINATNATPGTWMAGKLHGKPSGGVGNKQPVGAGPGGYSAKPG